jgi:hypothetical protein
MKRNTVVECSLGELIYELYEQAKQISEKPGEQRLLVYAALKDLLSNHPRKQPSKAA